MKIALVRGLLCLILIGGASFFLLWIWPLRNPHPPKLPSQGRLAITDVRIYVSPEQPPIDHASMLIQDGLIVAVGQQVAIPSGVQQLGCEGCTLTAGFWNCHIHLTEPKWESAEWKSAKVLGAQLADMLTSRGFTTVVDLGSDPRVDLPLRRRIQAGEIPGPQLYLAGQGLYPPNGIPYYLGSIPFYIRWLIPQPATPAEAARIEDRNISYGSDVLKLFTGSYVARGKVLPMPETIAKAAVDVAHRHGQLAFSHPSDQAGTAVAIQSGVDILAHAPDTTEGVAPLLKEMVDRHMAMIPTLKMFATTVTTKPAYLDPIYDEVRQFRALGGYLMFGTDVGYMTDYSTDGEFQGLAKSGLTQREMLRMLTTAPSAKFGVLPQKGTVEVGKAADLVLLEGDPLQDIGAFSRVRFTIRDGRILYAR
jgi:imidazolonepropionase-like amidohydrolase